MGNTASGPAPGPDPSGTDTPTPTPTRTGTPTPTASITPNISHVASYSPSFSLSHSVSEYSSQSVSESAIISHNFTESNRMSDTVSNSPSLTRSARASNTNTASPSNSMLPILVCGNSASYPNTWKSHNTAGTGLYLNNANCNSVITAPSDKIIQATVLSLNTEAGFDYIRIFDGSTTSSTTLKAMDGIIIPLPGVWTTTGNTMTIQFVSDDSNTGLGSVIRVVFLNRPTSSATVSSSVSSTPSITRSNSRSPSVSKSYKPSPEETYSVNYTSSTSVSKSTSVSRSSSHSPSFSKSSYISLTSTVFPSFTSSSSMTTYISPSTPFSQSPLYSRSATMCPSLSSSTTQSNTESPVASSTESPSYTGVKTASYYVTITPSYTPSKLNTVSYCPSITISFSPSPSYTYSRTNLAAPSANSTSTLSLTTTPSISALLTTTPSISAIPTARPKGPPPPLPADLTNMSLGQLGDLFNDMAYYDASKIQGSLNTLGFAALQKKGGEFSISTSAFSLKMAALDTSAPAALKLGTTSVDIPPLGSLGTGLAASVIQWKSNPYAAQSSVIPDTLPLSMSVLDTSGKYLTVKNLTTPIAFSFSLNTSDSKFQVAPRYLAQCYTNELYVKTNTYYEISYDAIQTGKGTWNVPCQMDTWMSVNCTTFDTNSIVTAQCPSLILTPKCLYWDTTSGSWSSDGCKPTLVNSSVQCSCTHLTDFATRIDAMAQENKQLFLNARNVYSLEGLMKYAQWYGTFGGIGLMTALLALLSTRIDILTTQKYVKSLCQDEVIQTVFENAPNSAIYVYDPKSTKKCMKKVNRPKEPVKEVNICQRILQQHTRIQFLFRYDPRLARIFRLLALFTIQFHSLFVSALFYGFTYGGAGKEGMMWYDIIILALLTSAVNIPVISTMLSYLNKVGVSEFKAKFPLLYEEYERRSKFEKYALAYLKLKGTIKDDDEGDNENDDTNGVMVNDDEESVLDRLLMYLCCKNPPEKKSDEISTLSKKDLLVKMIKVIKAKYPGFEVYSPFWTYLPCHTTQAWLFLVCAGGWLAWCLNYLLLFAASHEQSVGQNIMVSYATSELTTIFLSQPITIVCTYMAYKALNTYSDYIPVFIKKLLLNKKRVPGLYFFSNPWANTAESTFTHKFAYSLFVRCPAKASNTSELAYAPTKAVIHDIEEEPICDVEKLYNQIMDKKKELHIREVK